MGKCCVLNGKMKAKKKKKLAMIKSGEANIIIGTHAVVSSGVEFRILLLLL